MTKSATPVRLSASHRPEIEAILRSTPEFAAGEVDVALELVDAALAGSADYRFFVALSPSGHVSGYVCYGPTPMTEATFDLYWIVVAREEKGRGLGRMLVATMEEELALAGARLVRVETESGDSYAATRAFYDRIGYRVLATIRDFYRRGDALVIYGRYFE